MSSSTKRTVMRLSTLGLVLMVVGTAAMVAQQETRIQLNDNAGRTLTIRPNALSANREITLPNVSGTFFIIPSSGGGGTAQQMTRFGTTTGTLLNGSLSDDGAGTLSRAGSLTLDVTSLNVTGQTTLNSGTAGAYTIPTSYGRNYDALTSSGAGGTSFSPVPSVGTIIMHTGTSAPGGYLMCDGTAVSRTTYADLFAAIGTTYGSGDGATTFNLPDLRGRRAMGAGAGPGLTTRTRGTSVGAETISTTPTHDHNITDPGHNHNATLNDPGHAHQNANLLLFNYTSTTTDLDNGQSEINQTSYTATATSTDVTGISVSVVGQTVSMTVGQTGTNVAVGAVDVRNPFVGLHYIIKY